MIEFVRSNVSVGYVGFSEKYLRENSFERSLGKPYTPYMVTPDALSTEPLSCPVGMEALAHRSFAFKDSVNWSEQETRTHKERLQ
jgi:hypothetical protein